MFGERRRKEREWGRCFRRCRREVGWVLGERVRVRLLVVGEGAILPVAKDKALRAMDLLVRDVELRDVHNLFPLVPQ